MTVSFSCQEKITFMSFSRLIAPYISFYFLKIIIYDIIISNNRRQLEVYAIDRLKIIKRVLKEDGQAQVQTLSNLLGVSEVTVRRDLERLEAQGWLTRTHGGAVMNNTEENSPLSEVFNQSGDSESYDEIADVALRMISDGDVIMLTSGEANSTIASRLGEKNGLTVLTNDIACAAYISRQESNRVVILGGIMDSSQMSMFGSMTIANMKNFYVNRLFVEVDGISSDLFLTVNSQEKADLILEAAKTSGEIIVVSPSDRYSNNAFFRLGSINFAQKIISNSSLDETYKSRIFTLDIPLYTSIAAFEGSQ